MQNPTPQLSLLTKPPTLSSDSAKDISILEGDCNQLIKQVKSNSVHLIVTDPPYEINYARQEWDKPNVLNWHFLANEFKRVLKPNGCLIIFQGWSHVCATKRTLDEYFTLKNWIIYDRVKGRGAKTNLVSTREDILWYLVNENNYTYNKASSTIKKRTGGTIGRKNGNQYRSLSNVWTDIPPIVPWSKERVKHPTQKPLFIIERILTVFSNQSDVVLDPFLGSGTAAVAAKKLNRKFIGFEKDRNYYQISQQRLSEYGSLFARGRKTTSALVPLNREQKAGSVARGL